MEVKAIDWRDIDLTSKQVLRALDQAVSLRTGGTGNCVNCFYTTNTAQAFTLLDDYVSDDYTPRVVRILQPTEQGMAHYWKCAIMPNVGDDEQETFEAIESTTALAICKAWLKYMDENNNIDK